MTATFRRLSCFILVALGSGALAASLDPDAFFSSTFRGLTTLVSPEDPVKWMIGASSVLVKTRVYDLIAFVATALFSIAAINIGQLALYSGFAAVRQAIIRFFVALMMFTLTAYPGAGATNASSAHHKLLMLWPEAYLAATSSSYAVDASVEFNQAITSLTNSFFKYGTGAFVYLSVIDTVDRLPLVGSKGAAAYAGAEKLKTDYSKFSAKSAILSFLKKPAELVYRLLGFSVLAFFSLVLLYSLLLTIAGLGYLFAIALLPLASALWLFKPTTTILNRVLTAAIAFILLTALLPAALSITFKATLNRNNVSISKQVDYVNALAELGAKASELQQVDVNRAYKSCLGIGYKLKAAFPKTLTSTYIPSGSTTPVTLTYQTVTLSGHPVNEWCDETEHYNLTAEQQQENLEEYLMPVSLIASNQELANGFSTSILSFFIGSFTNLISGALAFFLFLGIVNITSQMISGISIGGALENPLL